MFSRAQDLPHVVRRVLAVAVTAALASVGSTALLAASANAAGYPEEFAGYGYKEYEPPEDDAFYTEPAPMPSVPAGTILRFRPANISISGIHSEIKAYQIAYTSTNTQGAPVMDVATILLPNVQYEGTKGKKQRPGPRPLLSYQNAEDSDALRCAPSYAMAMGNEKELALAGAALEQGWDVVVPDYEGLRSEYAAGPQEGHAVLDAVVATESFAPAELDGTKTPVGMWGYSGGALASTWASTLKRKIAPKLKIRGVAAGGVPVNIAHIAEKINGGPFSGLYLGAAVGVAKAWPELIDLKTLLNPAGELAKQGVENECVGEAIAQGAGQKIEEYTNDFANPLENAHVQEVVAHDELGQKNGIYGGKPAGPMYIYEATNDEIIPFADVSNLVSKYCAEKIPVEFIKDEASDHNTLSVSGAGGALNYLISRFAGEPIPDTCSIGGKAVTSSSLEPTNNMVTLLTAAAELTEFV